MPWLRADVPYYTDTPRPFYYRHWTSDDPQAVVLLLHGFGEHSGRYHRCAAGLTRNRNDVWGPDHVGHGLSGDHDGRFDSVGQLASNAETLLLDIVAQSPGLPLFIVGHSLGALTALAVAARHADKLAGLVLTGPPVVGAPDPLPVDPIYSVDPSYRDDGIHDPFRITAPDAERELWRAVGEFLPESSALVAAIDRPTLVIFGERDAFTDMETAARWTRGFSDGRLVIVPGGYHDILNDKPHRSVTDELCGFIDAAGVRTRSRPGSASC